MASCRIVLVLAASLAVLEADPRPVTVETAVLAPLATRMEVTGSVTASQRSRLSARTSGLIQTMHVDAGDRVKKGDLLMVLDPELAEIELESEDRKRTGRPGFEDEIAAPEQLLQHTAIGRGR